MTRLEYFISVGVKILDTLPEGWKELKNATTAPVGYKWVYNRKSHFSGEYEHALLKIND